MAEAARQEAEAAGREGHRREATAAAKAKAELEATAIATAATQTELDRLLQQIHALQQSSALKEVQIMDLIKQRARDRGTCMG